jgi:lysophospholipase L1-like esterase
MKVKQFGKKLLLILIASFIPFCLFEFFLRVTGYRYMPLEIRILGRSDWRYYLAFSDEHFTYDPYLIWRPKKNFSVFNSYGYRGKEINVSKGTNEFRIIVFGDSNVLGWIGESNWPEYLQELLGDRFNVINAGGYGYTSYQGLIYFKESLRFQPDMVLVSFGANDAHPVFIPDREYVNNKNRIVRKIKLDMLLIKFRVGQALFSVLDKFLLRNKQKLIPRVDLEEYKGNLNEIIRISKQRNIKVVLLTRPYLGESSDVNIWKTYAPAYYNATIEVAHNNAIPLIDVYAYFKDKEEFFMGESHFNEKGHREAAKFIYENIKSILNLGS